jgi:hypothetical protein
MKLMIISNRICRHNGQIGGIGAWKADKILNGAMTGKLWTMSRRAW